MITDRIGLYLIILPSLINCFIVDKIKWLNDDVIQCPIKWLIYSSTDSLIAWLITMTILKRLTQLFRKQYNFFYNQIVSGTVCILYHFMPSGPIVEDVVSVFRPRIKLSGLVHSWPCDPPTFPWNIRLHPLTLQVTILHGHKLKWNATWLLQLKKYKVQLFLDTKVNIKKVISERLIDKFWKEVGTFLFFFRTTKSKTSTKDNFTYL